MFFFLLLASIPVALLIFGAGYAGAIVWHAEPLAHGREIVQFESEEAPSDAWTATDGLILAGLRLNR